MQTARKARTLRFTLEGKATGKGKEGGGRLGKPFNPVGELEGNFSVPKNIYAPYYGLYTETGRQSKVQ